MMIAFRCAHFTASWMLVLIILAGRTYCSKESPPLPVKSDAATLKSPSVTTSPSTPLTSLSDPGPAPASWSFCPEKFVCLLNEYRRRQNAPALKLSPKLATVTSAFAKYLSGSKSLTHMSPDGASGPEARADLNKYGWLKISETVGRGWHSEEAVIRNFLTDEKAKHNLAGDFVSQIAVGASRCETEKVPYYAVMTGCAGSDIAGTEAVAVVCTAYADLDKFDFDIKATGSLSKTAPTVSNAGATASDASESLGKTAPVVSNIGTAAPAPVPAPVPMPTPAPTPAPAPNTPVSAGRVASSASNGSQAAHGLVLNVASTQATASR